MAACLLWVAQCRVVKPSPFIDVPAEQKDAELSFLKREIYQSEIELLVRRIDAYDRFSARV